VSAPPAAVGVPPKLKAVKSGEVIYLNGFIIVQKSMPLKQKVASCLAMPGF
jgi:hypothetical protein